MSLVLILTTGGSCEPLVKSIQKSKPDYTIFICSQDETDPVKVAGSHITVDGPGKPCKIRGGASQGGEDRESIVAQTNLGPEYESYEKLLIPDMDDLASCYMVSMEAITKAKQRIPGSRIRVDYTGGTKTMSAGLAMAAIDHGDIELYIVSGPRTVLTKVSSGTEMLRQVDWMPVLWMRKRNTLEELFKAHEYVACLELIEDLCHKLPGQSVTRKTLEAYLPICRGFQAWEDFRHQQALGYLEPYGKVLSSELTFLRSIIDSYSKYNRQVKAALGEGEGCAAGVKPNLALVHDILRNAERRLQRRQYDDAVGRIYRAMELLAQTCLLYLQPPIFTSDIKIVKLPEKIRSKYQLIYEQQRQDAKRGLQLPLYKAYDLLNDLDHPLGKIAWENKERMLYLVDIRNSSIFAHGLKPVGSEKANAFYNYVCNLLTSTEMALKITIKYENQACFPHKLPLSLDLPW